MLAEARLTLPKNQRISPLAYSLWSAGIYPWSWADQCGPDFLPLHTPEQVAGWQAYEIQQKREQVAALGDQWNDAFNAAVQRAEDILAEQGMALADHSEDDDDAPTTH